MHFLFQFYSGSEVSSATDSEPEDVLTLMQAALDSSAIDKDATIIAAPPSTSTASSSTTAANTGISFSGFSTSTPHRKKKKSRKEEPPSDMAPVHEVSIR